MGWLSRTRWSPYLVGALIGALSWFAFGVSNKPLGISTEFSQAVQMTEQAVAPDHAAAIRYAKDYKTPTKIGYGAMMLVGVVLGAFASSRLSGDHRVEQVPEMWSARFGPSKWKRYAAAFAGGAILMFGARLAGGCTSGHGISGSLQLALSSWTFFLAMFASGVVTAFALYHKETRHA